MVENDATRKARLFFLNDTASDPSSSDSDDDTNHTYNLLQHEKARKELQRKAMMVAA